MDDARPVVVAARCSVAEEAVDERAAAVARSGMHNDSRGIVDDEQVIVLPREAKGHLLRDERVVLLRGLKLDLLAAGELVALRARGAAVDAHRSRREQPF